MGFAIVTGLMSGVNTSVRKKCVCKGGLLQFDTSKVTYSLPAAG